MKERNFNFPAVGSSALLVMFAVLCLTVFSLLCISTAQADARLCEKGAASVTQYYSADALAHQVLARLRLGETVPGVKTENGVSSYACKISDTQCLWVEVQFTEIGFEILRWQAASTQVWEENSHLPVWDGQTGKE